MWKTSRISSTPVDVPLCTPNSCVRILSSRLNNIRCKNFASGENHLHQWFIGASTANYWWCKMQQSTSFFWVILTSIFQLELWIQNSNRIFTGHTEQLSIKRPFPWTFGLFLRFKFIFFLHFASTLSFINRDTLFPWCKLFTSAYIFYTTIESDCHRWFQSRLSNSNFQSSRFSKYYWLTPLWHRSPLV